jgi:4-amino-4-deoxy-L-arabinose transferase-like glycosyltransferase
MNEREASELRIAPPWIAVNALLVIWIAAAIYTSVRHPLISLSDMFDFIKRAEHLTITNSEEWVHGFFPIGYPVLLRVTARVVGDYGVAGQALSIVFGVIGIWATFGLATAMFSTATGIVAVVLLMLNPWYFQYAVTSGTDMAAASLMLASTSLMANFLVNNRQLYLLLSGMTLGFAYLMRYQALAIVPAHILAIAVHANADSAPQIKKTLAGVTQFAAMFVIAACPQLLASLIQTGNPFFNLQAKNALQGISSTGNLTLDWLSIAQQPDSLLSVIRENPKAFFHHIYFELILFLQTARVVPYPLDFVAYAAIGLAFVNLRKATANINLFLVASIGCFVAAVSILRLDPRFLIFVGMLLSIYAAYGLFCVTHQGLWRFTVIGAVIALVVLHGGIRGILLAPMTEADKGRVEVSQELHSAGMRDSLEVLTFAPELYDIASPSKDEFMTPWFRYDFPHYASIRDIAERMKHDGQRFLVYAVDAPQRVPGLDRLWPLRPDEMSAEFELISDQRGFSLWRLR